MHVMREPSVIWTLGRDHKRMYGRDLGRMSDIALVEKMRDFK